VGPVNTGIPHQKRSSLYKWLPPHACPSTVALEARLSHDRSRSGTGPGKCELSESVEPCGAGRLSLARSTVILNKCTLVPALCREGLFLVYCIRSTFMKRFSYGERDYTFGQAMLS